jgi:hypothetical protein
MLVVGGEGMLSAHQIARHPPAGGVQVLSTRAKIALVDLVEARTPVWPTQTIEGDERL